MEMMEFLENPFKAITNLYKYTNEMINLGD
jgi:hypothetical protein